MQISVPLSGKLNEDGVNAILPNGYFADAVRTGKFRVLIEDSREPVGFVELSEGLLVFKFFDHTENGKKYISAFGLEHPEYDPKKVLWGFAYDFPVTHLFQLDKTPYRLEIEALADLQNYDTAGNVYLVKFYQGEWTKGFLGVLSMQKVLPGGVLAEDSGPIMLALGNIENERTM